MQQVPYGLCYSREPIAKIDTKEHDAIVYRNRVTQDGNSNYSDFRNFVLWLDDLCL